MRVLVVQQDHVSPPGPVGEAFAARGYDVEEFLVVPAERFGEPGVDVVFPDPSRYDAVVPMGAPWSVTSQHISALGLGRVGDAAQRPRGRRPRARDLLRRAAARRGPGRECRGGPHGPRSAGPPSRPTSRGSSPPAPGSPGTRDLAAQGLDADQLLARTRREEPAAAARARALVAAFLDRVATAAT